MRNDTWRIVGGVALVIFVLVVGLPVVLSAVGLVIGGLGLLIGLAITLIKLAVVVAIGYLVLAGVRALMR